MMQISLHLILLLFTFLVSINTRPIFETFIDNICSRRYITISIPLIKVPINKEVTVTCISCLNQTMYLYCNTNLNQFNTTSDQKYDQMYYINNLYHYVFKYSSKNNNFRYIGCTNGNARSSVLLAETSEDKQLMLYVWRKRSPNYSFPNHDGYYEFILYWELKDIDAKNMLIDVIFDDSFTYGSLFDHDHNNFKFMFSFLYYRNLYNFHIRIHKFDVSVKNFTDRYIGYSQVLDYDKNTVTYMTREARHVEF